MLDDAIRDHLELKRRRGADPGEVAHLERRALGSDDDALADAPDSGSDDEAASGTSGSAGADGGPRSAREATATGAPAGDQATEGGVAVIERGERAIDFAPGADGREATREETIEIDASLLAAGEDGAAAGSFAEDR